MGTYAWYADPKFVMPHGDSVIDGAFLDSHIRSAIEDALHKKGYLKVDAAHATLLVAYYTSDTGVGEHDEYGNYEWATGYVVATNWEKERTVTDRHPQQRPQAHLARIDRPARGIQPRQGRARAQPRGRHPSPALPPDFVAGPRRAAPVSAASRASSSCRASGAA